MTFSLDDLLIAARTVFGEARGEPFDGQKAVAHVLMNRGKVEGSIAKACLRPFQFSCWTLGDPNLDLLLTVTIDSREFRVALRAVLEAADELDFTNGATHYHSKSVSPIWSRGKVPVLIVGSHLYFNNVA